MTDYAVRVRDGVLVGRHVGDLRGLRAPDGESLETFDDREAFDARVAELRAQRTPEPDVDGLLLAAFAPSEQGGIGKRQARALVRDYPDLTAALDRSNWQVARQAVADAHADGVLSDGERDTLLGLFDAYHIPEGGA